MQKYLFNLKLRLYYDTNIKFKRIFNEKHPISDKLKKLYKKDKDEFDYI